VAGLGSASRIAHEIDFDAEGRQAGYLRAPLSRNTSGWGVVEIPVTVIARGRGPTALFTGGIHGSEYEGQIAISALARTLEPGEVQGRVILMPAVNLPAVHANSRLSPLDGRDLNRCFPGDARGGFNDMLAHFLDAVILPMADLSVDVHSCGQAGDSALSTNMHALTDPARRVRTLAAAEAFGAPFNVVFGGIDEGATFTSSVERRGIVSLGTEVGGWGRVHVEGLRIVRRGLRNILAHMGIVEGHPDTAQRDGSAGTRHMQVPDRSFYEFAPAAGTFEPCHRAGERVAAGELAGRLHFVEDVDRPPVEVRYRRDGLLWMAAGPGRDARGDRLTAVMTDYDPR
jgi:N-alpha-acetyl-L-2,4-diaminobutyrate deacetylase